LLFFSTPPASPGFDRFSLSSILSNDYLEQYFSLCFLFSGECPFFLLAGGVAQSPCILFLRIISLELFPSSLKGRKPFPFSPRELDPQSYLPNLFSLCFNVFPSLLWGMRTSPFNTLPSFKVSLATGHPTPFRFFLFRERTPSFKPSSRIPSFQCGFLSRLSLFLLTFFRSY